MKSHLNAALRRLNAKRKVNFHGTVHYADNTEVGTIIDSHDAYMRQNSPIALERFIPAHRPPSNPPTLMANPVQPPVWEVVECFASMEKALPRAVAAKKDQMYRGATLRLRDRRTNDIIMCAVLL